MAFKLMFLRLMFYFHELCIEQLLIFIILLNFTFYHRFSKAFMKKDRNYLVICDTYLTFYEQKYNNKLYKPSFITDVIKFTYTPTLTPNGKEVIKLTSVPNTRQFDIHLTYIQFQYTLIQFRRFERWFSAECQLRFRKENYSTVRGSFSSFERSGNYK